MTIYDIVNFIIRLGTLMPVGILFSMFLLSIIRNKNLNGLGPVRFALIFLVVGSGVEYIIRIIGYLHVIVGKSATAQLWLAQTRWEITIALILQGIAYWLFLGLFKGKPDTPHKPKSGILTLWRKRVSQLLHR